MPESDRFAEAAKKRKARETYLRRKYGIGLDWYEKKLEEQGGRCAICLSRPRSRVLAVDHDHFTGALRGLLCGRCNHGLLQFAQEDITILKRAVEYLLSHLEGNATREGSPSPGGFQEASDQADLDADVALGWAEMGADR